MTDFPRLIEHAFPLKQASLDSVHEKNVRHGHISTLHIWPARRPLAACRAALIATLLPDPGTPEKRQELCEKIGGKVVKKTERKKMPNGSIVERVKEETEGGILHWGRETENAETLDWFRDEIRKAYGGRAPKVLDPFAGGGAIPLEAMRLGCEATAVDINPVAWFILKCTLEYPQKLAGQTRPLPEFILHNDDFMAEYFKKAKGYTAAQVKAAMKRLHKQLKAKRNAKVHEQDVFEFGGEENELHADLAWHVRAWGQWVLDRARRELAEYYPTYAEFEPIKKDHVSYERQPMKLVPLKEDGSGGPDIDALNSEFSDDYLDDKRNPRWIAKPTVAYLWARTVKCKNCRATVPLLKTRWLSKKPAKRALVVPEAADDGAVTFTVQHRASIVGGNSAQKREHDRRLGQGTMSKAGAKCLHCQTIHTHQDIQVAALAGQWSSVMTAVVVDGTNGKEFREVTDQERVVFAEASEHHVEPLTGAISSIRPSPNARGLSGLTRYGIDDFGKVFNGRQVASLQTFSDAVIKARDAVLQAYEHPLLAEAMSFYLAASIDRLTDRNSTLCHWNTEYEKITGTFQRYALRVNWDYAEVNPFSPTTGNYIDAVEWIARFLDHALRFAPGQAARVSNCSATSLPVEDACTDIILTDPPYYDAIPYSDLSDYYYVWLRRSMRVFHPEEFAGEITQKDGDLIQHAALANGEIGRAHV